MKKKILIVNGPNLNLLGKRNHSVYGSFTLKDLIEKCNEVAQDLNIILSFKQSNNEGDIITWIQEAKENNYSAIIINPGAYSHTSIAIMDAILDCDIDVIEVHISNIYARESFRKHSYTAESAKGIISGFGINSYVLALYSVAKT